MKALFTLSYPLVGLISLIAFVPQIKTLIIAKTSPVNVSIKSWMLWTAGAVISLGYGIYVLEDFMFCVIAGMSVFLDFVVVFLILYRRYVTFGPCDNLGDIVLEYFCRAPYLGLCPSRFED